MSLESWKQEFYPVPAPTVPKEQAVAHSLRKWEGLRQEGLGRHRISISGRAIIDENGRFFINAGTCSLCHLYLKGGNCTGCPLNDSRGMSCDKARYKEESIYHEFANNGNPEPMIDALRKAQEWEETNNP